VECGRGDDGGPDTFRLLPANDRGNFPSVKVGHDDVEKDDVEGLEPNRFQSLAAGLDHRGLVSHAAHRRGGDELIDRIVFDEEDPQALPPLLGHRVLGDQTRPRVF
jgi:hypothetical protein